MTGRLWKTLEGSVPDAASTCPAQFDTVVVGAGFTGLITALMLAEAGQSVGILEAQFVGAGASGATTAKVSVLQGTRLWQIADQHGLQVAYDYLHASRFGLEWIAAFAATTGLATERATAFTFAASDSGIAKVASEHRICQKLGLRTRLHTSLDVPFPVKAAVSLDDQIQLDPAHLLTFLTERARNTGVVIAERCKVIGLKTDTSTGRTEVLTNSMKVTADHVVLATAAPILDRGFISSQMSPQRSYLCAFDVTGDMPEGMFISAESPARSVRTVVLDSKVKLLVGGNGHRTGALSNTRQRINELIDWTDRYFPHTKATHRWSAQDQHPHSGLPLIKSLPRSKGAVLFAGGYSKWGLTGAPAAAQMVVERILERSPTLSFGRPSLWSTVKNGAHSYASTVRPVMANLLRSETRKLSSPRSVLDVGNGCVRVGRVGLRPAGYRDSDGESCRVSLVCPHLGATLAWNDAENSWDCPLHGSRFSADGSVLEGPATRDLDKL